jgi:hypothetical protein
LLFEANPGTRPYDPYRHHRRSLQRRLRPLERDPNDNGDQLIWLEPQVVNKLRALRGPGQSYSEVIMRLVEAEARGKL